MLQPDEAESFRHSGAGRHPVSEINRRLDPGLPRDDEFSLRFAPGQPGKSGVYEANH